MSFTDIMMTDDSLIKKPQCFFVFFCVFLIFWLNGENAYPVPKKSFKKYFKLHFSSSNSLLWKIQLVPFPTANYDLPSLPSAFPASFLPSLVAGRTLLCLPVLPQWRVRLARLIVALVIRTWLHLSFYRRELQEKSWQSGKWNLTIPMLRLLSSNAHLGHKDFWKPSKPYHVGIHWMALAEHSQMSTHVPGFQPFFSFFCIILYWPN